MKTAFDIHNRIKTLDQRLETLDIASTDIINSAALEQDQAQSYSTILMEIHDEYTKERCQLHEKLHHINIGEQASD